MKHTIARLREMEYVVELDGCDILWRFSGTGQPDAGEARELLTQLRDHKEAAVSELLAERLNEGVEGTIRSTELTREARRLFDCPAEQPFDSPELVQSIDPFDRENYPADGTAVVLPDPDCEGRYSAHRVGPWPPVAIGGGDSELEAVDELLAAEGARK